MQGARRGALVTGHVPCQQPLDKPELPAERGQLCLRRLTGATDTEQAEIQRVEAAGGWVADERVCDILMVSRAFGDADFKGAGLDRLLAHGVECAPAAVPHAHSSCPPLLRRALLLHRSRLVQTSSFLTPQARRRKHPKSSRGGLLAAGSAAL